MSRQISYNWNGSYLHAAQLSPPWGYSVEQSQDTRGFRRPRANRLPQEVSPWPRPLPTYEIDTRELGRRPLFIGSSEDAARRHFSHLTPGLAFGHSQEGRFGTYGRQFWKHVGDIYDWERALCHDPCFRPGIRELATGIRLIVGDEFVDHIATPHGYLEDGKSFMLSEDQRLALQHVKYLVMFYKSHGVPGQEDYVIILLAMPDQTVNTFAAHHGTPESKDHLHDQAVDAMNKMLEENTLSRIEWRNGKNGWMMRVTSASRWANPYLTLEAFRVFIREARRQISDYEDWPDSARYKSFPLARRSGETARDFWCTYLRGALGHRSSQPLMILPTTSTQRHANSSDSSIRDLRSLEFPAEDYFERQTQRSLRLSLLDHGLNSEPESKSRANEAAYRDASTMHQGTGRSESLQPDDYGSRAGSRGFGIANESARSMRYGSEPAFGSWTGSRGRGVANESASSVSRHGSELAYPAGDDETFWGLPQYRGSQ